MFKIHRILLNSFIFSNLQIYQVATNSEMPKIQDVLNGLISWKDINVISAFKYIVTVSLNMQNQIHSKVICNNCQKSLCYKDAYVVRILLRRQRNVNIMVVSSSDNGVPLTNKQFVAQQSFIYKLTTNLRHWQLKEFVIRYHPVIHDFVQKNVYKCIRYHPTTDVLRNSYALIHFRYQI